MEGSTIIDLLSASIKFFPDRTYVQQDYRSLTYQELEIKSDKVAKLFCEYQQTCIGILSRNSIEFIIVYYGIIKSGNIAVPINYDFQQNEIFSLVKDCNIQTLFLDTKSFKKFEKCEQLINAIDIILIDQFEVELDYDTIGRVFSMPHDEIHVKVNENDLALIIYTSGTNGKPNGVCLSHKNLVSNAFQILKRIKIFKSDKMFVILPFYYSYGNSLLLTHLIRGAALSLCNNTIFPVFLIKSLKANNCTSIAGVASHFVTLFKRSKFKLTEFEHLRYITFAGESVADWLLDEVIDMGLQVYKMYGQTEASARLSILIPEEISVKKATVGKPLDHIDVKIIDEDGTLLPIGKEGEILCKGDNIMRGYLNQNELTNQKLKNGYLYTGDYGKIDEDGYLYVNGRKDEMMKVGGHRIFPLEIEKILLQISQVKEAGVVGIQNKNKEETISDYLGSSIIAFVVTEGDISTDEIVDYCKKYLPVYKVPSEVHKIDELPKTTTGKLKRNKLKKIVVN